MNKNIFAQPWYIQMVYIIIFGALIIVSTVGNSLVIWIILGRRQMRSATNYFIVNMSVSDTLVAALNIFFNFIYMMNSHWPFGQVYCVVSNFVSNVTLTSSVFTLVAISIDRYFALVHVLHKKLSLKKGVITIVIIWTVSFIISLPYILYSKTYTWVYQDNSKRTVCYLELNGSASLGYELFLMISTYFVPVIILAIVYIKIGLSLWWSELIGEETEKQLSNIKSKRRVVKMMILVTLIFALCYLPYQTYFLIQKIYPYVTNHKATQHIFLILYWIGMSNSMYNPLIYYWLNIKFRQGFKSAFRWCPFVHYVPIKQGTNGVPRRTRQNRRRNNFRIKTSGPKNRSQSFINEKAFKLHKLRIFEEGKQHETMV